VVKQFFFCLFCFWATKTKQIYIWERNERQKRTMWAFRERMVLGGEARIHIHQDLPDLSRFEHRSFPPFVFSRIWGNLEGTPWTEIKFERMLRLPRQPCLRGRPHLAILPSGPRQKASWEWPENRSSQINDWHRVGHNAHVCFFVSICLVEGRPRGRHDRHPRKLVGNERGHMVYYVSIKRFHFLQLWLGTGGRRLHGFSDWGDDHVILWQS